jgi:hypothetical protein
MNIICEVETKCIVLFVLALFCKVRAMSKVANRPRVSLEVRVRSRLMCVKFGVQTILEKRVFLRVFRYFLVSIILLMVHTHFLLNNIPLVTERKAVEGWEP